MIFTGPFQRQIFHDCIVLQFLGGPRINCLVENDVKKAGDLATGLLFTRMDTGEKAIGKSITVVPINIAYSTLKEKFLQFFVVSS